MDNRVRFYGGWDLERALKDLGPKVAKKVARAALRKAAKAVLDSAREKVPVDERRLKRSLRIKVNRSRSGSGEAIEAEVSVSGRLGYRPAKTERARYSYQIGSRPDVYAKFVEFGTKDTAAQPFMRPAWDEVGGQPALIRIAKELGSGIEKSAAQLKKG